MTCTDCHARQDGPPTRHPTAPAWIDRPALTSCRGCHEDEAAGFLHGKHGMRLAAGLAAMRPEVARLPMRADARGRELGCSSCHGSHAFDRRRAAVGSCLECHDDRHSRAYLESSHHERWEAELGGRAPDGTGVSCATCHLPRVRRAAAARPGVVVEHDQNASLRPVETMVRPVCLGCHGLGFSLAALADPSLVERSFDGPPASRARTVDMVRDRARRPPPAAEEEPR